MLKEKTIDKFVQEIRKEQHPIEDDETLKGYIKDAEYDINDSVGIEIDYEKDLKAKKLLKNYVLYDRYKRLAEFKNLYVGEYSDLQARYYKPTNLQ